MKKKKSEEKRKQGKISTRNRGAPFFLQNGIAEKGSLNGEERNESKGRDWEKKMYTHNGKLRNKNQL